MKLILSTFKLSFKFYTQPNDFDTHIICFKNTFKLALINKPFKAGLFLRRHYSRNLFIPQVLSLESVYS
jgi:hypothetical protein